MKVVTLSPKVEEQYLSLFEKTKEAIRAYKSNHDIVQFKSSLCGIIDDTPNVCRLDPDLLYASYDLDFDEGQWCEFSDEESGWYKEELKRIIRETDEFRSYQLSLHSSGSVLFTLFGDAYYELYRGDRIIA